MPVRIDTLPKKLYLSRLPNGMQEFSCYLQADTQLDLGIAEAEWKLIDASTGYTVQGSRSWNLSGENAIPRLSISAVLPPNWGSCRLSASVKCLGEATQAEFDVAKFVCDKAFAVPMDGQVMVLTGHRIGEAHRLAWQLPSQQFGWDLAPLDENGLALLNTKLTDSPVSAEFFGFGQPVKAPTSGKVARIMDGFPDLTKVGVHPDINFFLEDLERATGNCVILDCGDGVYCCLAHLQEGSIKVRENEPVKAGQIIGALGNSGFSTGPHLHLHFMDGTDLVHSSPLPVELTMEGQRYAPQPGEFICN